MERLLKKLKDISLNEVIKVEESDFQFFALKNLFENLNPPVINKFPLNKGKLKGDFYLSLIIANSLICYQLSSNWEKYWEEFSNYFSKNIISNKNEVISKLWDFVKHSKWNKRFIETKIKRLEKLKPFLNEFIWNEEFFYENMEKLCEKLAKTMNQKITDKTIVFAVKMFSYGARNYFNKFTKFPFSISIPIDSRLTKIYKIYNEDKNLKIDDFYDILARKLNIPPLHLDAVLWVNFDKLKLKNLKNIYNANIHL